MIANEKDYLATRTSYKLNLKGPSLNINTACSTSLVAVCQACQSLLSYQCDVALAGGVAIEFPQKKGSLYQEGGITSADGHCRAFDERATGMVPGEGVGVVVLRRLSEALADGDHVYAVIRGFAVNNDGAHKVGYTAPSVEGQAEVIALAQAMAACESGNDLLRRGARHRHASGGPDRDRRPDPRVQGADECAGLLRHRVGEDQHRAPGRGRGRRRPHQDGARAAARPAASQPPLHEAESADRLRRAARSSSTTGCATGTRQRPATSRSQLLRHRRHERSRRPRGGACARSLGTVRTVRGPGLVGEVPGGAGEDVRQPGRLPESTPRREHCRRRLHAAGRAPGVPASAGCRLLRSRRRRARPGRRPRPCSRRPTRAAAAHEVAELWMRGAAVDWRALHAGRAPQDSAADLSRSSGSDTGSPLSAQHVV